MDPTEGMEERRENGGIGEVKGCEGCKERRTPHERLEKRRERTATHKEKGVRKEKEKEEGWKAGRDWKW